MFYFFLIVVVIGLSFWLELKKEVNHEVDDDNTNTVSSPPSRTNPRPVAGRGYRHNHIPDKAQEVDDFENARKYVEQLKRQRTMEDIKNSRDVERDNPFYEPTFDKRKNEVKKTFTANKKLGRNYVEKNSLRKSIKQLERETAEIQAKAVQSLNEIEQMKASMELQHQNATVSESDFQSKKSQFFKDKNDLRRAFVASEILSKPLSLRK